MQRTMQKSEELYIENPRLDHKLCQDLINYDIIYIQASLGWGKYTFLSHFSEHHPEYTIQMLDIYNIDQQLSEIPVKDGQILLIPRYEKLQDSEEKSRLWKRIQEQGRREKYVFASTIPLPDELLAYKVSGRLLIYGIKELKPGRKEVDSYFCKKGIHLYPEELARIEYDFNNIPICLYLLENPLLNSSRGYCRIVREQCLEDLFSWIEVDYFRTFRLDEQYALVNLSCFEQLTEELVWTILDMPSEKAREFIQMLRMKGSILDDCGNGCWQFTPLFRRFLARIIYKYLDQEKMKALYNKAMHYYEDKRNYFAALKFADLLKNREQIALQIDRLLSQKLGYDVFLSLEEYCLHLSDVYLEEYPRLVMAKAMLQAMEGDLPAFRKCEQFLNRMLENCLPEKGRQIRKCQLFLKLIGPGGMTPELLKEAQELADQVYTSVDVMWDQLLVPGQISILHGDKDYCSFFPQSDKAGLGLLALRRIAGRKYASMVLYMQAEVSYEYNRLDEALDSLSESLRHARLEKNERMQKLCNLKMADLMIAQNQAHGAEEFLLYRLDEEADARELWTDIMRAHKVQFYLLKNDEARLNNWLTKEAPNEKERFCTHRYYQYLMKAKVYIWQEQYVQAGMLLRSLLDFADQYGMIYLGIQIRALEAIIHFRCGNPAWIEKLEQAILIAKEYGFIRVLADEGEAIYELLADQYGKQNSRQLDPFVKQVMTAARAQMLIYPGYLKQRKLMKIDSFSSYERDVLHLLAKGEKNAEIAKALCVSENTVKYHLKNIYQKLGAKNRSQAINLITEYHIL